MISEWRFAFGLAWALAASVHMARCQRDLELDYSNEYDNVRPNVAYPDEPRLDKHLAAAAQELGEAIRNAWQSMADSFRNYFEELRSAFAEGADDVETFPQSG